MPYSKKELIIMDVFNHYKFYVLQENGFINISKICRDYNVSFDDWKNIYYQPLYQAYQRLCQCFSLQQTEPLIEKDGELYIELSMAFHFIYWVSLDLGIGFCANIIPFLCEYFKQ